MPDSIDWRVIAALLSATAAIFGLFIVVFRLGFDRRVKMDEFLIQSLPLFGGGTQNRNVAIAVTEGYCQQSKRFREIIVPVLVNQAIYLLFSKPISMKETGKTFAVHEKKNIHKIVELLAKLVEENSLDPKRKDYQQICSEYERLKKAQVLNLFDDFKSGDA